MVFKKLSETEKLQKEIDELKRLKTRLIEGAHKMVGEKKFGKAQQAITTLGIVIDKLEKMLPAVWTPPDQAEIVKVFSDATMQRYNEWAVEHDRGYITYLKIIEKNPKVLEEILKIPIENVKDLDKIPEYVLSRKSE